jgi:hypothetical protein
LIHCLEHCLAQFQHCMVASSYTASSGPYSQNSFLISTSTQFWTNENS